MKSFFYENSIAQKKEVICYAYSLDVLRANTRNLENFYNLLVQHYPHFDADGQKSPYDHTSDVTQQWHSARSHVAKLIDDRKTKVRHWQMWVIGFLTLCVLVAILVETAWSKQPRSEPPAPVSTKAK